MWDKGGSDLYVIRQILDLKRRYPTRVHLLMGNRDLNKIRICQEMGVHDNNSDNQPLPHHPGVYWIRNHHVRKGGDPNDPKLIPSHDNAADRLKWILAKTMGSPKAFDLRKLELERERLLLQQQQQQSLEVVVTDEDVVQSYRQSCHPTTGEMGNYLSNACLALKLGELMVVHGAMPLTDPILHEALEKEQDEMEFWKDMSFAHPWQTEDAKTNSITTCTANQAIHKWLESLDQFRQRGLQAWREECSSSSSSTPSFSFFSTVHFSR